MYVLYCGVLYCRIGYHSLYVIHTASPLHWTVPTGTKMHLFDGVCGT